MTTLAPFRLSCSIALLASCSLAQLRWEVVPTPQAPAPRFGHAIAGYGFLFGGRDQGQAFADVWNHEPWGWRAVVTTTAPSARHGHALGHRSYYVTQMIDEYLLFGGEDLAGTKDGTTWRFTGSYTPVLGSYPVYGGSWQQLVVGQAPSPRSGHAMAYDYTTATECLLFGGTTSTGVNDETWRFANGTWQPVNTAVRPPARTGHQLLAVAGGFVLCGGTDGTTPCSDSWFFDGVAWQALASPPFAGQETRVAFSDRHRHAVLSTTSTGTAVTTTLHERTLAGEWLAQEQSGLQLARTGAATWDWLQPTVLMLFGGRDASGQALGDTLRLVPEHPAAQATIGTGCGPGAWGNQGPDILAPWQLLLGSSGTIRFYTASAGTLAVLGLQLGAAPAPSACQITVVPELLVARITDAQQLATVALDVPFATALRGLQVSMQALAFEPQAANGLAISRVTVLSIGD